MCELQIRCVIAVSEKSMRKPTDIENKSNRKEAKKDAELFICLPCL